MGNVSRRDFMKGSLVGILGLTSSLLFEGDLGAEAPVIRNGDVCYSGVARKWVDSNGDSKMDKNEMAGLGSKVFDSRDKITPVIRIRHHKGEYMYLGMCKLDDGRKELFYEKCMPITKDDSVFCFGLRNVPPGTYGTYFFIGDGPIGDRPVDIPPGFPIPAETDARYLGGYEIKVVE